MAHIQLLPKYEIDGEMQNPIDPSDPDEQLDYIQADHFNMIDFRGQYLFVLDHNKQQLQLIDTLLSRQSLISHRLNGNTVSHETLLMIAFRLECYNVTKNLDINDDLIRKLANWYIEIRKDHTILSLDDNSDTSLQMKVVRYYVVPQDLYHHFRNFDPLNETHERFERDQAINELKSHNVSGSWLLRHSSYNRPKNPNTLSDIIKFGIRYYVLSYSKIEHNDMIIKHVLITYNVATGWSTSTEKTLFPNFIDCLENILQKNNLTFSNIYADYINI